MTLLVVIACAPITRIRVTSIISAAEAVFRSSMTDGLDDDQEQGSDLPLPDDIDGPLGNPSSHTDPPGRLTGSRQSEQMTAPDRNLADGDTAAENLFGVEMTLDELMPTDPESTFEQEGEEREASEEAGPTREQLEAFDNLVHQSMLGVELADNLTLPWEQGIFRSVFGDAPIWEPAEIPLVSHSVPGYLEVEDSPLRESEPATKRKKTSTTIHGLYDRAITFSNTLTDPELDKNKWARALEKLYTVFTICPQGCPAGITLDPSDMASNLDKIRQLCGSRSPGTVSKRANSHNTVNGTENSSTRRTPSLCRQRTSQSTSGNGNRTGLASVL